MPCPALLMSRAFVKEDIDIPERKTLRKSASGLPPGALNLMTAEGARHLRQRLKELQWAKDADADEIASLEHTLESATIVEPKAQPGEIVFGSRVTVRKPTGEVETLRIVGVDEVALEAGNVSGVSPLGKALLAAAPGKAVRVAPGTEIFGMVVKMD